ncbi:ribbon-helix-helix protein, CopG family [Sulfobacillus sp. DSM 109850]|uniref:Ribbon-helix-helix protein, CopG family n=1 Tax=Sulfobacillus harzensis TaxID=2729629 RepID=A0A7Y0L5P8_9FIRM|nr:ribbon-helix-helix protein, CopG family [Sulfobacillus harzensis]
MREKEVGVLTDNRRVVVRLPHHLVDALDQVASGEGRHRSELIRESVEFYLAEQRRQEIRQALIQGYQEMGFLNSALAEERWDLVGVPKE